MKHRWKPEILQALETKRLLIISPFDNRMKRVTRETAFKKNETISFLTDKTVVGYVCKGGQLEKLLSKGTYYVIRP